MGDDQPNPNYNEPSNVVQLPTQFLKMQSSDGGGGDGVEPRIARLEADVSHLKSRADEASGKLDSLSLRMSEMKTDLAVLNERASHFATKSYSIVTAVAIVAALSGLILFADRLKTLLGVS